MNPLENSPLGKRLLLNEAPLTRKRHKRDATIHEKALLTLRQEDRAWKTAAYSTTTAITIAFLTGSGVLTDTNRIKIGLTTSQESFLYSLQYLRRSNLLNSKNFDKLLKCFSTEPQLNFQIHVWNSLHALQSLDLLNQSYFDFIINHSDRHAVVRCISDLAEINLLTWENLPLIRKHPKIAELAAIVILLKQYENSAMSNTRPLTKELLAKVLSFSTLTPFIKIIPLLCKNSLFHPKNFVRILLCSSPDCLALHVQYLQRNRILNQSYLEWMLILAETKGITK